MNVVVCDASPLIFLAKLDRLSLIEQVLGGRVVVLRCVVEEAMPEHADPVEKNRLGRFFEMADIVDYEVGEGASAALSRSDRSTLRWARENEADWLVVDERMLRRVARDEGLAVIGFLGILIGAVDCGILSAREVREAVDEAVGEHGCRISVAVYRRILAELDRKSNE